MTIREFSSLTKSQQKALTDSMYVYMERSRKCRDKTIRKVTLDSRSGRFLSFDGIGLPSFFLSPNPVAGKWMSKLGYDDYPVDISSLNDLTVDIVNYLVDTKRYHIDLDGFDRVDDGSVTTCSRAVGDLAVFSDVFKICLSPAQRRLRMFNRNIVASSSVKLDSRDRSLLYRMFVRLGRLGDCIFMNDLDQASVDIISEHCKEKTYSGVRNFALITKEIDFSPDGSVFFKCDICVDGIGFVISECYVSCPQESLACDGKLCLVEFSDFCESVLCSHVNRRMPLKTIMKRVDVKFPADMTGLLDIDLNRKFLKLFMKRISSSKMNYRRRKYFIENVNPDAMTTLLRTVPISEGATIELSLMYLQCPEHGLYRRQAFLSCPVIMHRVMLNAAMKGNETFMKAIWKRNPETIEPDGSRVLCDIDQGRGLMPFLRQMGYSKQVLRMFMSRSWQLYGKFPFHNISKIHPDILQNIAQNIVGKRRLVKKDSELIELAASIHRIPVYMYRNMGNLATHKTRKYSNIMDMIALIRRNMCDIQFGYFDDEINEAVCVMPHIGSVHIRHRVFRRDHDAVHQQIGINNVRDTVAHLDDMVEIVHREFSTMNTLRRHVSDGTMLPMTIGSGLFVYHDLNDMARANAYYHDNIRAISNTITGCVTDAKALKAGRSVKTGFDFNNWPAYFEDFTNDMGSVHIVTNASEIVEEGINMNHCVGGYINRCLMSESIILQIDTGAPVSDGVMDYKDHRRSTAEIAIELKNDGVKFRIIQNRAYGNAPPAPENHKLLETFLAFVIDAYKKDKDAIHAQIVSQSSDAKKNISINLPFDRHVVMKMALPEIRELLPARFARLSITRLRQMIDEDCEKAPDRIRCFIEGAEAIRNAA